MYTLMRENIERTVSSEIDKDRLLAKGFSVIEVKEDAVQEFELGNNDLESMTIEELKAYAEENDIDLGKSTSHAGILEKIRAKLG